MLDNKGEPDISASRDLGNLEDRHEVAAGHSASLFLWTHPDGAYVCALSAV